MGKWGKGQLSSISGNIETTGLVVTVGLLLLVATAAHAGTSASVLRPIPDPDNLMPAKVRLGEQLFHDPRLSADHSVSCASCHRLAEGGDDGRPVSTGIHGRQGKHNAPTVFNARFNVDQNWDGNAPSLAAQINGPVQNPNEMGMAWQSVVATLADIAPYRKSFEQIYPDGITAANIRDAIAEFEKSLVTVDAPFDRYLRGERDALTPTQREGYRLFRNYGCASCHNGRNVGGNMYAHMGIMGDYFADHDKQGTRHLGRFNVTGEEGDRHLFRVPSLRLAVDTAPYLHDGSVDTLADVIQIMAEYQLGRQIPEGDVKRIEAFLHSLKGEFQPYDMGRPDS